MTKKRFKPVRMGQNATLMAKWLLAVDPFSDLNYKVVADFVREEAHRAGAQVLGVYILAPDTLNWTGDFSGPWLKRYKPVAEQKAEELGRKLGIAVDVV